MRVVFLANALIPTLQLSFLEPLRPLVAKAEIAHLVLTEQMLKERGLVAGQKGWNYYRECIRAFKPDVVVACRYSGPYTEQLVDYASLAGIPLVVQVDDDLLNIPKELGEAKFNFHNAPSRLGAVRRLLSAASLIYCSTPRLLARIRSQGFNSPAVAADVYCASCVLSPPKSLSSTTLGYMGFDHVHDFQIASVAIGNLLDARPTLSFEIFGPISLPVEFQGFGTRVRAIEPVRNYTEFRAKLASLDWAVGICPLAKTAFNEVKADTKWVEYTASGFTTLASADTIYDQCCNDECGVLVADGQHNWVSALDRLFDDPIERIRIAENAQRKLSAEYSPARLSAQVQRVLKTAMALR